MKKITLIIAIAGISMNVLPMTAFGQTASVSSVPVTSSVPGSSGSVSPDFPIRVCPFDTLILQSGDNGDNVRILQSFLAQDTTIYPEGLTTGYFGLRTGDAVRKFQARNGLPQTGNLDIPTRDLIFPCANVHIVSPNGGEIWNVGETHQITWKMEAPIYTKNTEGGTALKSMTATRGAAAPANALYPYFTNLSIDLTDSGNAVYHIGSASIYTDTSFSWIIPSTIPQSANYKVRISMWKDAPRPFDCKTTICPMIAQIYPIRWNGFMWDESDAPFAINGGTPAPSPLPTPLPDTSSLIRVRQQISDTITQLQNTLALLDKLIAQLANR